MATQGGTFMSELSTMMAPVGTMRLWSMSCTQSISFAESETGPGRGDS